MAVALSGNAPEHAVRAAIDQAEESLFAKLDRLGADPAQLEVLGELDLADKYATWLEDGE